MTIAVYLDVKQHPNKTKSSYHVYRSTICVLRKPAFCKYVNSKCTDITKTSPCNENPLTPHFYIVKLGFTGVCFIFLILL